jgi:2-succinyl-6-hydroxy-2,4-cyclohexadiene-1-carboxylate synthase
MTRVHIDGASYEVRIGGDGPPLLMIHGFTGRGSDWSPLLPALQRMVSTITVDLLGHGDSDSPAEPARHAIERQAADLAAVLRRVGAAPAAVMGYSMGARIALRMAIASGGVVARLILESPSAGIADPAERAERRASDEQLARLLDRQGIQAFVTRWEEQPLFASERQLSLAARARLHSERLRCNPDSLAASLRGAGQGSMEALQARLGSVKAPTLIIAGDLDEVGLERAAAVAAGIPGARMHALRGVGHAPHREAPERVAGLIREFIAIAPGDLSDDAPPEPPPPTPLHPIEREPS